MIADGLYQVCHCVVIGNGLLALVGEFVGHLACVDQFLHVLGDEAAVLADLLDEHHIC